MNLTARFKPGVTFPSIHIGDEYVSIINTPHKCDVTYDFCILVFFFIKKTPNVINNTVKNTFCEISKLAI